MSLREIVLLDHRRDRRRKRKNADGGDEGSGPGGDSFRYFRLNVISKDASSANSLRIGEFGIYDNEDVKWPKLPMTAMDAPSPYEVISNTDGLTADYPPWKMFDNSNADGHRFLSIFFAPDPIQIIIDMGENITFSRATISTPSDASPVEFNIEGSATGEFAGEETILVHREGLTTGDWPYWEDVNFPVDG